MTRTEMLNKLKAVKFEYIWPPSEWEDIGFTERPIWVNSKGYGYLSCDDSSEVYWIGKGIEQEKWNFIQHKLLNDTLTIDDIEDTSLFELINEHCYLEENINEFLKGLSKLPRKTPEIIYWINSPVEAEFYATEEEFEKAYKRDWCDYYWDELEDDALSNWIKRLFV